MEITPQQNGDILTLTLVGRLDATWSGHVQAAISSGIRGGAHRIHLDMSGVQYLSSAGISALLNAYKELTGIQGEFAIPRCSEAVKTVLELSGLGNLLSGGSLFPVSTPAASSSVAATSPAATAPASEKRESEHALYEIFPLDSVPPQRCRLWGDPAQMASASFAHSEMAEFPEGSLAVGLGAFGTDFRDGADRFGEMLAVGGSGACLPTDGSRTPDYIITEGALIPRFQMLCGVSCHGKFTRLLRFEAREAGGRVGLEELARTALAVAGTPLAAVAIVAEASSLVGAALQRPPVGAPGGTVYDFPRVRDWFSFTAERAHTDSTCVVTGVVSDGSVAALAPFVRAIGDDPKPVGHFHAAAFTYRPVRKGKIDLKETVSGLFQHQHLEGVLHLLADTRGAHGAGESEFFRGAIWVAAAEVSV